MPKGVTEPFIFRFVFAWVMKYLHHFVSHFLKQDLIGYDIGIYTM